MGLSGKGDGLKTYFLKVQGLKKGSQDPVHIKARTKNENGDYAEVEGMFFDVEGRFEGIKVGSFEYEGEEKKYLNITLVDDAKKERYVLQLGFNNLATGILNSMAQKEIGTLKIRVYNNEAGYPSSYVEVNGEKASWALDFKELNEMKKEVKVGKKVVLVRDDLDEYLIENVIPTIKVDALAMATASMEENGVEDKSKDLHALHSDETEEDDDDMLPF